jgi:hypothetical protein
MNIIEETRKKVIQSLPITDEVKQAWKGVYIPLLGDTPSSADILSLGKHLKDLFNSTKGDASRSQSDVSQAGTIWEALITWYINLCCTGSRVLAFKGLTYVPSIIKEAVSVTYGTLPCAAEPDIIVLIFPDRPTYTDPAELDHFKNKRGNLDAALFNAEIKNVFSLMEVGIIQCKTNWNENAQIPMLWDIIYRTPIGRLQGIKVGTPPYSILYIPFTYSFVTVPTTRIESFKPTSVSVARVKNLSGGNYWGMESASGIALSLDYIFQANYSSGFLKGNINNSLNESISQMNLGGQYDYFLK